MTRSSPSRKELEGSSPPRDDRLEQLFESFMGRVEKKLAALRRDFYEGLARWRLPRSER